MVQNSSPLTRVWVQTHTSFFIHHQVNVFKSSEELQAFSVPPDSLAFRKKSISVSAGFSFSASLSSMSHCLQEGVIHTGMAQPSGTQFTKCPLTCDSRYINISVCAQALKQAIQKATPILPIKMSSTLVLLLMSSKTLSFQKLKAKVKRFLQQKSLRKGEELQLQVFCRLRNHYFSKEKDGFLVTDHGDLLNPH